MLTQKFLLVTFFLIVVDCRHTKIRPTYVVDTNNILLDDFEDFLIESQQPFEVRRLDKDPSVQFENKITTRIQNVDKGSLGKVIEENEESSTMPVSQGSDNEVVFPNQDDSRVGFPRQEKAADVVYQYQDNSDVIFPNQAKAANAVYSNQDNSDVIFPNQGKAANAVYSNEDNSDVIFPNQGKAANAVYSNQENSDVIFPSQGKAAPVVNPHQGNSDVLFPNQFDPKMIFGHPALLRVTRQVQGSASTNPDGSFNLNGKLPLVGNDQNVLSAIGSANGLKPGGGFTAAGGGLALDNINGHSASLTGTHIPKFGDQLTAAGRLNLVNTPDHNLNANAFVTRTMPSVPHVPNFNTAGGSLDYNFRQKVGASLGMSHTPLFQKTDYSAMGNFNVHRTPSSSLDLNAGFSKSVSPFMQNRGWQPSGGISYSRYF